MYITKEYVELQVKFVEKLCELDNAPFDLYFMIYADAPNMLKIDFKIWHPHEPVFMDFSKIISNTQNMKDTIYEFSIAREELSPTQLYTDNPYGYFFAALIKVRKYCSYIRFLKHLSIKTPFIF